MPKDERATSIPPRGRNTDAIRKRNKANVRRVLEAFNTGETEIIDELVAPTLVSYTQRPMAGQRRALRGIRGDREGLKKQIAQFRQMFPDARFEVQEVIAEADVVYLRWKMVGTPKGNDPGRPLRKKKITIYGHETVRLARGKQVEHRGTTVLLDADQNPFIGCP